MRKIIVLLTIMVSVFSGLALAEDAEQEEAQVREIGVEEVEVKVDQGEGNEIDFDFNFSDDHNLRMSYGPQISYLILNVDSLNEELDLGDFSEEMILFGSGGSFGSRDGSRYGFFAVDGEQRISNQDKKALLELDYSGFVYEKGFYAGKKIDLALGSMLGHGNMNLTIRHNEEESFNQAHGAVFKKEFLAFKPRASINYKLGTFIGLELTGGYLLTYNRRNKWDAMGREIKDDTDDIEGPTASLRLSFGF